MKNKYYSYSGLVTGLVSVFLLLLISGSSFAQNCVCAQCGAPCKVPMVHNAGYGCPGTTTKSSKNSSSISFDTEIKLMVIQSLIDFIFSDNTTDEKEKERQLIEQQNELKRIAIENDRQRKMRNKIAQELHNKLMALYKKLPDSGNLEEKNLLTDFFSNKSFDGDSTPVLSFKDINETPPVDLSNNSGEDVHRNFFGSDVSAKDIKLITDPDNDPMVVKLEVTKEFINTKSNEDKLTINGLKGNEVRKDGEPIIVKEKCSDVNNLLAKYVTQREKFQQTINLSSSEMDVWREGTKEAMKEMALNVAGFAFDRLLDVVKARNEKAFDLKKRFKANETKLREKIKNYDDYMKKLDRQIIINDGLDLYSELTDFKDKFEGTRNITHALALKLDERDKEMKGFWEDPLLKEFLSDDPKQDAMEFTAETIFDELLDKDNIKTVMEKKGLKKLIGKNGIKKLEMFVDNSFLTNAPVVAYSQFAVTTAYDLTNITVNYYRVLKANDINDDVLKTANMIQRNINDTYLRLNDCEK